MFACFKHSAPRPGSSCHRLDLPEGWQSEGRLSEGEYFVLLASLLEAIPGVSNTSGTYAAYLKFWESRSKKQLTLTVPPPLVPGTGHHDVFRKEAVELAQERHCDILYLDPPYNSRQYANYYHLLETVALYDNPPLRGKAGLRPCEEQKSSWCNAGTALADLKRIAESAAYRLLVLSYNSEGIMPHESLCEMLTASGKLTVHEREYPRYRSDRDRENRRYQENATVVERIYVIRR